MGRKEKVLYLFLVKNKEKEERKLEKYISFFIALHTHTLELELIYMSTKK